MTISVRDLLFEPGDDPGAAIGEMLRANGSVSAAAKLLPIDDICAAVWDLLDLPLNGLIESAWDQHALVEAAKVNTRSRAAIERIAIGSHVIRSRHEPKIEFDVAGAAIPALRFELAVSLNLQAATVTVSSGAVKSIAPGAASANASLGIAGRTVCERKVANVALGVIERAAAAV